MQEYEDLFKPSFLKNEKRTALPSNPQVTMSYVPLQLDLLTYDEAKGLNEGTLFPELNKPFVGRMVSEA